MLALPVRPFAPLSLAAFVVLVSACGGSQALPVPVIEGPNHWQVSGTETRTGALDAGDVVDDGFYVDLFDAEFPVDATVRLVLTSEAIDTVIRVELPDGRRLRNDDFWDGTNSMVQFQAQDAGRYRIEVTSYAAGEVGAYALEAQLYPAQPSAYVDPTPPWDGELRTGALEPGGDGSLWLYAEAGERLTLRVTSPQFDTTAYLFAPNGQSWFNDDANDTSDGGRTLDSTISAIAPVSGNYQLIVSSYGGGGGGNYRIVGAFEPPITVADGAEIPDVGYAGTDTAGRIYGIFVGIRDYSPTDQLPGCDDDATLLAAAFRQRRLQAAADQTVLTNKAATLANLENAIARVAGKATADDVVVIFFSGHGAILEASADDRADIDGTDETLVLIDGQLRDQEFARLLDRLRVNTIIVALDSCQSGGFARDVIDRPGRIGLFSSDEDVLSSTAEPVEAGGYLSWMMRQAVLGHADTRPADGALLAGELGDYLIEQGVAQHENMNPNDTDPLQRIIIERGSYNWTAPLWVFPRTESGDAFAPVFCDEIETGAGPVGGVCGL